jgi:hypothetical protein
MMDWMFALYHFHPYYLWRPDSQINDMFELFTAQIILNLNNPVWIKTIDKCRPDLVIGRGRDQDFMLLIEGGIKILCYW